MIDYQLIYSSCLFSNLDNRMSHKIFLWNLAMILNITLFHYIFLLLLLSCDIVFSKQILRLCHIHMFITASMQHHFHKPHLISARAKRNSISNNIYNRFYLVQNCKLRKLKGDNYVYVFVNDK